jgi:hypothetical protein
MKNNPLYINDSTVSNPISLFESFIGHLCPKRLKNESFIESFISVFLLKLEQLENGAFGDSFLWFLRPVCQI